MTQNERDMIFELAKALSSLTDAVEAGRPETEPLEFDLHVARARQGLQNFIKLVDAEWMPK